MSITKREKYLLWSAILLGTVILFSSMLEPLFFEVGNIEGQISRKSLLVHKYKTLLMSKEFADKGLRENKKKKTEFEKYLFNAGSPSIAAAEIQKFLHDSAEGLSVSIESEKVFDTFDKDIFTVIPVEIVVKSDLNNLVKLLHKIENGNKYINIGRMKIKVTKEVARNEKETIISKIETRGYSMNIKNSDNII